MFSLLILTSISIPPVVIFFTNLHDIILHSREQRTCEIFEDEALSRRAFREWQKKTLARATVTGKESQQTTEQFLASILMRRGIREVRA